jgi:4-hydroxythreonine-4-phosphate dehydrogenase
MPCLAVTLGDPRGIGPEVMVAAALELRAEVGEDVSFVFLGGGEVPPGLERAIRGDEGDEGGQGDHRWARFESVAPFDHAAPDHAAKDLAPTDRAAGIASVAALDRGVELCLSGACDALVTGPVSKPALHAAGARFPGQTEFLGARTGAHEVGMLMASESMRLGEGTPLRILLLTTHLPLRDVPDALTPAHLEGQLTLLHQALVDGWGIAHPRIALCAVNPHASDGGLFGDEEARVLEPAVARLRAGASPAPRSLDVRGPYPADTVFLKALSGEVDAVAVPAHDVGMAVFKTLAFGTGVNVTLGLPFPRTSPDHGTAFDRAGTGTADPSSALAALRLAHQLASRRAGATAVASPETPSPSKGGA